MNRGITKENLLLILPPALTKDKSVVALAEVDAEALAARPAEINKARVIANIDGLDEAVLDILAHDFKIDWWDPNYSLEEKRQTFKDSWYVHKHMGTKAAVERAISAIYPHTRVLEWWEYGGEPYHFRLDINITNDTINSDKQRRVLQRVNYYKSLRSHNDGVTYFVEAEPAVAKAVVSVPRIREELHTSLEIPVPTLQAKATVRTGIITGLWETFSAAALLPFRAVQSAACASVGALAGAQEIFTVGIALPEPEPPKSTARIRAAGISGAWQESYTTTAITLPDKKLSASGQARAGGAVVSTQGTATTHINLQEVDYGRTQ